MKRQARGCPGDAAPDPRAPSRTASKARPARHALPFPPGQSGRPGQARQPVASHAALRFRGCIHRHVQRGSKGRDSSTPRCDNPRSAKQWH